MRAMLFDLDGTGGKHKPELGKIHLSFLPPAHTFPIPIAAFHLTEYDYCRAPHRVIHGKRYIERNAIFYQNQGLGEIPGLR
jgi:hypothetical protein